VRGAGREEGGGGKLENPEELTQLNFKSPVRRAKFPNNFHHAEVSREILNMTGAIPREREREI